jgi:hypothetical protein
MHLHKLKSPAQLPGVFSLTEMTDHEAKPRHGGACRRGLAANLIAELCDNEVFRGFLAGGGRFGDCRKVDWGSGAGASVVEQKKGEPEGPPRWSID